ncbi:hypothetical protein DFH28DRAFT_888639 [Melampsora americana]|nr:hypothetical protein DFH28DRAFT_888639 [Melampsora americana]
MLKIINASLLRIHIPTWIKRAIRVLGKASFGKLKADEWRNLFSLQLPLVLIPLWFGEDNVKTSLLKNFLHLVSLLNLALKREITSKHIERYSYHIQKYLEGSLQLFKHCHLAPNHHIAVHLAKRLMEFGSVRAWWSFPFERMMGKILQGSHNNHIGELEITFLKSFCRAGNLATVIQSNNLPDPVKPYISKLQSLYEPKEPTPKRLSNSKMQPLEEDVLDLLVKRLNGQENHIYKWMKPNELCLLSNIEAMGCAAVQPQVFYHKQVIHDGVAYSTFINNQDDSFVIFKAAKTGTKRFGRIISIFTHCQSAAPNQKVLVTWLHVQSFPPIPAHLKKFNPFHLAQAPDVQAHLCSWAPTEDCLIRIDEILAHCAWVMYRPGELRRIDIPTVGLVSTVR